MSHDHAPWGFVPVAVFVEAAIGPDGPDETVCGRRVESGFFHDLFEDEAQGPGTLFEEAESVSVSVHCFAMTEFEFAS